MMPNQQDLTLRKALSSLTEAGEQHAIQVTALMEKIPHSIIPVESVVDLTKYTCLVYACGFAGNSEYEEIALLPGVNVFAGKDFFGWLKNTDLLIPETSCDGSAGNLIVYVSDDGDFIHIGEYIGGNRVRSKWGNQGLFEHDVFEVPMSYGDNVIFYRPLDKGMALESFFKYAESLGVEFE